MARHIVDVASDKQANDVLLLDVRGVTTFTDYLVIMSAGSGRQLTSVADDVEQSLRNAGVAPHHREGSPESGWVLLDYVDCVVHVFGQAQRDYYQLERVWGKAKQLVRMQ